MWLCAPLVNITTSGLGVCRCVQCVFCETFDTKETLSSTLNVQTYWTTISIGVWIDLSSGEINMSPQVSDPILALKIISTLQKFNSSNY